MLGRRGLSVLTIVLVGLVLAHRIAHLGLVEGVLGLLVASWIFAFGYAWGRLGTERRILERGEATDPETTRPQDEGRGPA